MARFCSKCGAKLKEGTKICGECENKIGIMIHPLDARKVMKVLATCIVIAIILTVITVFIGIITVSQTDTTNKTFVIETGFPLSWFRVSHINETGSFDVGISDLNGLYIDLFLYIVLCFILSYVGEIIYIGIKKT